MSNDTAGAMRGQKDACSGGSGFAPPGCATRKYGRELDVITSDVEHVIGYRRRKTTLQIAGQRKYGEVCVGIILVAICLVAYVWIVGTTESATGGLGDGEGKVKRGAK